ncbi:MAG: transposase [Rhodoferax sp.]|nr:transposase [Rhodoferax sp.]
MHAIDRAHHAQRPSISRYTARRTHRTYAPEFKAELVAACQAPGASIAALARQHGMNANVPHRWLKEHERSGCHTLAARSAPGIASFSSIYSTGVAGSNSCIQEQEIKWNFARACCRWSSHGLRARSRSSPAGPLPFSNDPHMIRNRCSLAGHGPAGHARRHRLCAGACDRGVRGCPAAPCLPVCQQTGQPAEDSGARRHRHLAGRAPSAPGQVCMGL